MLLISCACNLHAQDSFLNPYPFSYEIDYSSEFVDSIASPEMTMLDVRYDPEEKVSECCILYNGEQKYHGRILDMQLDNSRQIFVLEKYFSGKYDACLMVVREAEENSNIKVGMLYYADQKKDVSAEKTCYCMLLKDVEANTKH